MEEGIIFSEKQRFRQWWLWLILFVLNGVFLNGAFKQIFEGKQFGDQPMSNTALLISVFVLLLITFLFVILRLETRINNNGVYVRFYPFHLSFRYFPWESINLAKVRKYSPIMEFGGWGIRFGLITKGRALNVSGNQGLQLEFNNYQKLLIGTHKPEELKQALHILGKDQE
ncbi:hypothetical protein [Pedobacter gandavensis]|uniref:PH domain-containing protein n=1 Tax=Pedobacter gandavensis TaxID=2679963 RepID=A0ABR6F2D0_9SPHI|nr:hypothetical protein [Pedobacter gandavensis]MBB2150838.1 hypothetical protein [Pedobacter gandavensis]